MPLRSVRCLVVLLSGLCAAGCADVAGEHVGLSLLDGYAAPGETVRVAAFTRRSVGGNVTHVQIERSPVHAPGWVLGQFESSIGGSIETDSSISSILRELFVGEQNHPMVEFDIPIPADSQPSGTTSIDLRLNYELATWSGSGTFQTGYNEGVLSIPITIVAPGGETVARLRDIAARCGLAFALGIGCLFSVSGLSARPSFEASRVLPLLCLAAVISYVYATFWYVSQPLAAILGWPLSGYRLLLWLGTMAVPLVIVALLWAKIRKKPAVGRLQTAESLIQKRAA